MSRPKGGPSLFELIRKAGSRPAASDASVAIRRSASDGSAGPCDESDALAGAGSRPAATGGIRPPESLCSIEGPRLVISLSSVSAGVCVFLLIVVIAGAFLAGQIRGRTLGQSEGYARAKLAIESEALTEIDKARRSTPKTDVFAGMASSPVSEAGVDTAGQAAAFLSTGLGEGASSSTSATWVKGHTYIVVQEFLEQDLADAQKAGDFLAEHGVSTSIVTYSGRSNYKYRLVTQKGFNCDDPLQKRLCDDFHERIRKLGALFVKGGGRYDLQGYQKRATANHP